MRFPREGFAFTVFLGGLSALPPLSIDMGLPGIPGIEAAFPGAAGRGPLTLSLFLAGFAASPLLCGPLADRFGRKPTLLAGLAVVAAAALACTVAQSFAGLLACRLAQGLAAGACVVVPLAVVRDVFDGAVARHRLSQVTAVLGIAPMLAPILGSWVMQFGGWRTIYAAQAATGLVLLAVTSIGFTETLEPERRRSASPAQVMAGYRAVLADRSFVGYTLVYALGFACMFSFISGSPSVMIDTFGLSPRVFSLLFGLTSCGVLLGSLASGRMSRREVASRAMVRAGLAFMGLCALGLLAVVLLGAASVATVVPLVSAVIFGFGLMAPSSNHEALRGLPHVAGAASGLLRCTQMVMGAGASALVAAFEPFGHAPLNMAILMAVAATAAVLVYAGLTRSVPASAAPTGRP